MATITARYNSGLVTATETIVTTIKTDTNPSLKGLNDLTDVDNNLIPSDGDLLQYNSTTEQFETATPLSIIDIEKGSLDKTFTLDESYNITLDNPLSTIPIVSVTKEVASGEETDNTWDVEVDGSDYDVEDFAKDTTLTPSATNGSITVTLGAGTWSASDVGKTISGNGGVAVITSQSGTAVANATTTTDFNDTTAIASGLWTLKGLTFDATNGVQVSNIESTSVNGSPTLGSGQVVYSATRVYYNTSIELDNGNIMVFLSVLTSGTMFAILDQSGAIVTSPTAIDSVTMSFRQCTRLSTGNIALVARDGSNSVIIIVDQSGTVITTKTTLISTGANTSEHIASFTDGKFMFLYADVTTGYPTYIIYNNDLTIAKTATVLKSETCSNYLDICELTTGDVAVTYIGGTSLLSYIRILTSTGADNLVETQYLATRAFYPHIKELSSGNILLVYKNATSSASEFSILSKAGTVVKATTSFDANSSSYPPNVAVSSAYGAIIHYSNGAAPYDSKYVVINDSGTITHTTTTVTSADAGAYPTVVNTNGHDPLLLVIANGTATYDLTAYSLDLVVATTTSTSNQYLPAITNASGQVDTSLWLDIDSMSVTDITGGEQVLYAISNDARTTYQIIQTTAGAREIVRNNLGAWEYNSNATYASTTWTSATTNTEFDALAEAMSVAANKMTGTQLNALIDSEQIALGDTLDRAIILHTSDATVVPSSKAATISYVGQNLDVGAINGTDYTWTKIDNDTVQVTALVAGNYKVRVV